MTAPPTVRIPVWIAGRGDRWFWTGDVEDPDSLRGPFTSREAAEQDARDCLQRAVDASAKRLVDAGLKAIVDGVLNRREGGWVKIPRGMLP